MAQDISEKETAHSSKTGDNSGEDETTALVKGENEEKSPEEQEKLDKILSSMRKRFSLLSVHLMPEVFVRVPIWTSAPSSRPVDRLAFSEHLQTPLMRSSRPRVHGRGHARPL